MSTELLAALYVLAGLFGLVVGGVVGAVLGTWIYHRWIEPWMERRYERTKR